MLYGKGKLIYIVFPLFDILIESLDFYHTISLSDSGWLLFDEQSKNNPLAVKMLKHIPAQSRWPLSPGSDDKSSSA